MTTCCRSLLIELNSLLLAACTHVYIFEEGAFVSLSLTIVGALSAILLALYWVFFKHFLSLFGHFFGPLLSLFEPFF